MADIIPAFPLSLIAFPGEHLNLHIFEPRYKQLIHECDTRGITFAILPVYDDKDIRFATEMRLLEISRTYADGKMDIKTEGVGLLAMMDYFPQHPNKLYPGIEFERLAWDDEPDIEKNLTILDRLASLYAIMNIDNVKIYPPERFRTYQIAHKIGLNVDQEIHFLSLSRERDRQDFVLDHLEQLLPVVKEMEILRKRAEMNGHFKNVIPRG